MAREAAKRGADEMKTLTSCITVGAGVTSGVLEAYNIYSTVGVRSELARDVREIADYLEDMYIVQGSRRRGM